MLKINQSRVRFESQMDSEFNEFISIEFTQLREQIRTFLGKQCAQMTKLKAAAAKGDANALERLLLKEKSRACLTMAIRTGRSSLEESFNAIDR